MKKEVIMARKRRNVPSLARETPLQNVVNAPIPQQRERQSETEIKFDESLVRISEKELQLITEIQGVLNSKILIFFADDRVQIKEDVAYNTFILLRELGKTDRIDMILHSRGGQTEVPAKLVSLIRNYCDHFGVIIPYRAHSAATHIAIGANEIIMGPMSELGPVDPSKTHPLLPKDKDGNPIPISVQDLKHVMDLLKREGPEQSYTPEALATIFSTMFEYVHPLAMGAIEQSYALAKLISKKLLATHMDSEKEKDKIEYIANELSDGFKSHLYQIGWREAKELGLPITYDDGDIYSRAWQLYELFNEKLNQPPNISDKKDIAVRPILILGTEKTKHVLYELNQVIMDGPVMKLKPIGTKWISSSELKA
jgi:hypothetical protein